MFLYIQLLVWAHANNDYVIHMYCFDPRQITDKTYKCGFVKCDKYRLKFLIETIENLNGSLINKGRCEYYPLYYEEISQMMKCISDNRSRYFFVKCELKGVPKCIGVEACTPLDHH